jgi:hypothetical protein
MLAVYRNARDNSEHSVQPHECNGLQRPESVSRVFPPRDRKWGRTADTDSVIRGQMPGSSSLDCVVPTTRPMSLPGRTVAA